MSRAFDETEIEHGEHVITVRWFADEDMGPPWKEDCGHGPVSDWTRREAEEMDEVKGYFGERVLCRDRGSYRYYDFAEAIRMALRDGWDAPPYKTGTKMERAVRSAEADFERLRGWCENEWHWCGYTASIAGTGYQESLCGIESDSMEEYTATAIETAKAWLDREEIEPVQAARAVLAKACPERNPK